LLLNRQQRPLNVAPVNDLGMDAFHYEMPKLTVPVLAVIQLHRLRSHVKLGHDSVLTSSNQMPINEGPIIAMPLATKQYSAMKKKIKTNYLNLYSRCDILCQEPECHSKELPISYKTVDFRPELSSTSPVHL
jgi:hypothetical protein